MTEAEALAYVRYVVYLHRSAVRRLYDSHEDAIQSLWVFCLSYPPKPGQAAKANIVRCCKWMLGHERERQERRIQCCEQLVEPSYEQGWPDCDDTLNNVLQAVAQLPAALRNILFSRCGLGCEASSTRQVAAKLGVSESEVRRLEKKAVEQVTKSLKGKQ